MLPNRIEALSVLFTGTRQLHTALQLHWMFVNAYDPKSWGPLESHRSKVQVHEFPSITYRLPSGGSVMLASPSVPCHPQTCVNAKLVDGAQGAFFF